MDVDKLILKFTWKYRRSGAGKATLMGKAVAEAGRGPWSRPRTQLTIRITRRDTQTAGRRVGGEPRNRPHEHSHQGGVRADPHRNMSSRLRPHTHRTKISSRCLVEKHGGRNHESRRRTQMRTSSRFTEANISYTGHAHKNNKLDHIDLRQSIARD